MEELNISKNIELKNPTMIAGWPGMGSVALGVVDYLVKALNATKFAQIKIDPSNTLDSVVVEDGLAALPPPPQNAFYYTKNPDLIIFEGEAQVQGQAGIGLLNKVLNMASKFKTKRIYTGAAFPLPISHREEPELYGAANVKWLRDMLVKSGVNVMESGHISGLNGLILGFAKERGIEAVCLLATMPQYAISLPNPKASGAIIGMLKKMISFNADMHGLTDFIREMDDKMAIIEDKVKDVLPVEKEYPASHSAEKKIPAYIMEKVEKLFRDAKLDKSKAIILKEELDRWDLYKAYEDRFLDLFKGNQA